MKNPEINKLLPKVLIPMIRDTFPNIVQSEIVYVKEDLSIEDLEDYAFYQSGLSADGCLEKLDDYTRKAIKRYGEILLEKQKEDFIKGFKGCCYCCEPVGMTNVELLEK